MIKISKIDDEDYIQYDFVICPCCGKGRLCDKPKGARVNILHIDKNGLDHVVVKCPKCGSRYLISVQDN